MAKIPLAALLKAMVDQSASDLHISPGHYPVLRIDGRLIQVTGTQIIDPETAQGLVLELVGQERKDRA